MNDLGISAKLQALLDNAACDAFILFGADNFEYVTGAALPFLYTHHDWPCAIILVKNERPLVICPAEVVPSIENAGRQLTINAYLTDGSDGEAFVNKLVQAAAPFVPSQARVNYIEDRVPTSVFQRLHEAMPGWEWQAGAAQFARLRMIKSDEEIALLEEIAHRTDHAILGASHHIMINLTRSEKFVAEDTRVHALERFLDVQGYNQLAPVASGDHARKFWPLAPKFGLGQTRLLQEGEFVRLELQATLNGYWSNAARMITMGEPSPGQEQAYDSLIKIRETLRQLVRPGTVCRDIAATVHDYAASEEIKLIEGLALGHSVGTTSFEPPYLSLDDPTKLEAGMVLVLDPIVLGPQGEIVRSKDTLVITEDGNQMIGWYKDWREPYIAPYAL